MNKLSRFLVKSAFLIAAMMVQAHGQILITGFGTGAPNPYTVTFSNFTDTQTASTLEISGNDFTNTLVGNVTPVSVGNPSSLQLTASYSSLSTSTANFQIELVDSNSNGLIYQGNLNSFSPRNSDVTLQLNFFGTDGAFNGIVSTVAFSPGGSGSSLDLTLNTLTTTAPEPSAFALLAIGAVVVAGGTRILRKSKIAVS